MIILSNCVANSLENRDISLFLKRKEVMIYMYSLESFLKYCDDIAEEGLIGSNKNRNWKSRFDRVFKSNQLARKSAYLRSGKSAKATSKPIIKNDFRPNPRNQEAWYENPQGRIYMDWLTYMDSFDEPATKQALPIPSEIVRKAKPLLDAYKAFEKEMLANLKIFEKETGSSGILQYPNPGQFALFGDDKKIILNKCVCGYDLDVAIKTYGYKENPSYEIGFPPLVLNKIDEFIGTPVSNDNCKVERIFHSHFNKFEAELWKGKDNTDLPPEADYRFYWWATVKMNLY